MLSSIIKSFFGNDKENFQVVSQDQNAEEKENYGEHTKTLWQQLKKYLGKDVTSLISLPIWVFEPVSFLQFLCQPMQYSELLDKASREDDPCKRLVYLTAFIVGGYTASTRTKKPFNPYLGETYEYISKERNFKFVGEQVSHHPPIGVSICQGDGYILELELGCEARLKGNYADVIVQSTNRLQFTRYNELITWTRLNTTAHNIFIGGTWIDYHGTLKIVNQTTSEKSVLNLTKSGFLGSGRYKTEAQIYDRNGQVQYHIFGHWNDALYYSSEKSPEESTLLWKNMLVNYSKNEIGPFNRQMNEITEEMKQVLPPTDSRFRPDRLYLELGQMDVASREKTKLENDQRAQRRKREEKNERWNPRYFKREADSFGPRWKYLDNYWQLREQGFPNLDNDPYLPSFIEQENVPTYLKKMKRSN